MTDHISSGKFIAFEGLDGSGSSTQIELLAKALVSDGQNILTTKEPTNNLIGGLIRGLLTKVWQTSPEGFQLLFAADRAHHLEREILPAMKSGKIVLSDRYLFSTLAFGSIDLPLDWLASLNGRFPIPDLTILLKVKPETCIKRIGRSTRGGYEFFEEKAKLEKTWATYDKLAAEPKNKIIIVDGERSPEIVAAEIFAKVKKEIL